MYFKQVELVGFKSFADRTVVRLEPGITSIVGPNGCGKSNILDALRWALGEQRAKELRGSHMQDVIFNGSDTRQPTGMAEVSLTFDNADSRLPVDFAEVQVTRRIYRSGESEYLLNKAPCRLRDIHELFMDTGIGTDAYSIIGQGKISLVLSSKPEDRRFLFEEAAGIIKYKSRKRVAMRKLTSAEVNLQRLSDIIAEVERQMRSLKRQVNAAIRYRELTDQLRELEIRSIWLKYTQLSGELGQLREQFAKATDSYEKMMAEISQLEAHNEQLSLKRIELDRVLSARREGVHELETEMEKIERQIALLRQQMDFSKEQEQRAIQENKELEERAEAIQKQIADTGGAAQRLRTEIEERRTAVQTQQEANEQALSAVAQAEAHLEQVRGRAVETMNNRAKTQTELETLQVTIQNIDGQLEEIYGRSNTHHQRTDEVSALLQEARSNEAEKQEQLARVTAERSEKAQENASKTAERRALREEWQALREKKSSTEARLHSLRELRDSYEGFAVGVRAIMMAKQKDYAEVRGVIGPAGDLLSTDKSYERAVEAALGGNINNIICEEAEAAKSSIGFLKKHRAGRVTFLPLDTIRPNPKDDYAEVDGRPGVIGPAIRFVQHDRHIRKAVEYLLHNTVIVETIDDAIRIARSGTRFPRMVTLDGEVVSSAGAVTGGRTQHESRGLLGRSAEIAELEDKVAEIDTDTARKAGLLEQLGAQLQRLAEDLKSLEATEQEQRRVLNDLGVVVARYTTELDNLSQTVDQLKQQSEDLETRRQELEAKREEALARADSMQDDDVAIQSELAQAQDVLSHARQAQAQCASELGEMRVALAELVQRVEETERNAQREEREREEVLKEAQRRLEQAARMKENQSSLEGEIAANIEQAKVLAENKDRAHGEVVEAQNEQQQLLDENDGLTKQLRENHESSRATQGEVHRLEIALRHNEDQIAFFEERILSEYHVALSSLKAEEIGEDDLSDEDREQQVSQIRNRLDRMGQVNLMAIEEYEALEKRHAFLKEQEEDLQKARETLLSIVARIDKTIKAMFLDTFEKVGDSFREFFRRLFNGGQARIYLLDEDDPLESGIEIEARPPGKKPQSISLLSGGEQAMTAISLLFSIMKARPSPFCVLDEVDAPLDDANIGRFLEIVEEFTSQSQFIIITHNKQTMARANILYGVTMQERGVSQLVSVKFAGVEEEPAA